MLCVLALPADDARPRRRSAEEKKELPAAADSSPPFPTHEHVFGLEEDLSEDDEPEAPAVPVVPDARRMTREERYAARGKATLSDDVEDLDGVSAAGHAGASAAADEDGFDSPSESAGRGKTARSPSAPGSGGRGKKKQRAAVGVRLRLKRLVSVRWSQTLRWRHSILSAHWTVRDRRPTTRVATSRPPVPWSTRSPSPSPSPRRWR